MKQEEIDLVIFDMNGTLTNTPFIDEQPLCVLPGRKKIIQELIMEGFKVAMVTNQGGVAFGFQTEQEATQEISAIAQELGIPFYAVCFAHPSPKAGYEKYAHPVQLARRKPAPGMLIEAMQHYDIASHRVLMIGDRPEDREAALNAGCDFALASDFFSPE